MNVVTASDMPNLLTKLDESIQQDQNAAPTLESSEIPVEPIQHSVELQIGTQDQDGSTEVDSIQVPIAIEIEPVIIENEEATHLLGSKIPVTVSVFAETKSNRYTLDASLQNVGGSIAIKSDKKNGFSLFGQSKEDLFVAEQLVQLFNRLNLNYLITATRKDGETMISVSKGDTIVKISKGNTCLIETEGFSLRLSWY